MKQRTLALGDAWNGELGSPTVEQFTREMVIVRVPYGSPATLKLCIQSLGYYDLGSSHLCPGVRTLLSVLCYQVYILVSEKALMVCISLCPGSQLCKRK